MHIGRIKPVDSGGRTVAIVCLPVSSPYLDAA